MILNRLYEIIEESITIDKVDINEKTSTENTEGWDSLGHITLLSALDEETEGKSADIPDLAQVSTVGDLIKCLQKNNLLEA